MSDVLTKVLRRCKKDPAFFIDSFIKILHPSLGIIPFRLFKYQRRALKTYTNHRFVCWRKCRQSGISTLTGVYALWMAMFQRNKTILVVSRSDEAAKDFLLRNIKTPYRQLPQFLQDLWPIEENEHRVFFSSTNSVIKSKTSAPDVLRSESASLNIIDEAGFIPKMGEMWTAGYPTLVHGGRAIIISTPSGLGTWYWQTFDDALKGENDFTPIEIDWWDMDWELEWIDETSGEKRRIAPCDDIEPVEDPDERELLGPYKSPWLIDQYRALQAKGEAHRFHQEVLARFIGSGNTVLRSRVLTHIRENTDKDFQTVSTVDYANPINGERDVLDFRDQLRVWEQPIRANQCPNCRKIVKPDSGGFFSTMMGAKRVPVCPSCLEQDLNIEVPLVDHIYVMGVDVSSGEANDFSAIQIFDCYKRKQVAELKIKVLPKDLCKMADFLGRYYNNAYMVVERTGIGTPVCQELNLEYCYPNLYRQKTGDGEVYNRKKKYGHVGFPTSATGKPKLIKCLINEITDEIDEAGDPMGVYIASDRLSSELMTFIYHTEKKIGAEEGNHDDLVMACALALLGLEEAIAHDMSGIMPMHYDIAPGRRSVKGDLKTQLSRFTDYGGKSVLPPIINSSEGQTSAHDRATIEMMDFMRQMMGGDQQQPVQEDPAVVSRRHVVQARIKPKAK